MRDEVSTGQVADYLGVKVQTVYAYVSRGVLTPVRREAGTGSLFALADVQALAGRGGRAGRRQATSDDVRTAITQVGPGSLAYRGHDVRDLVGGGGPAGEGTDTAGRGEGAWTFEQVRDLLTGIPVDRVGERASGPPREVRPLPGVRGAGGQHSRVAPEAASIRTVTAALPDRTPVLDRFKHAVLLAGSADVGRRDRSPDAFARAGARALAAMIGSLPMRTPRPPEHDPGVSSRGQGDGQSGELDPEPAGSERQAPAASTAAALTAYLDLPVDLLDLALVLLADHDLAVSTTAVRVAVSAGSDPYSALLAGLAAADSPLHVGASVRAVDWLGGALDDPRAALDVALATGPPPGFGHVVYTETDPRAQLLLDRLLPESSPEIRESVMMLEQELTERRGWVLNIDAALALLVLQHGLPRDAGSVIFACARTVGWTAHAIEELAEPGMRFRLRGVYTGSRQAKP